MKKKIVLCLLMALSFARSFGQYKQLSIAVNNVTVIYNSEAIHVNNGDLVLLTFAFASAGQLKAFPDNLMVRGCFLHQKQQQQQQQKNSGTKIHIPEIHMGGKYDREYYVVQVKADLKSLTKTFTFSMSNEKDCQGDYYPVYLAQNKKKVHGITLPNFYLNH